MIYFIQVRGDGPVKIGYALNPEKRFQEVQTCNHDKLTLLHVVPGAYSLETKIHNHLKKYNIHGEWFRSDPKVMEYIQNINLPDYETDGIHSWAVLWRDFEDSKTDHCPFCGEKHVHGIGDGHRGAHCTGGKTETYAKDGTILHQKDGYILKTRKKKSITSA